MLHRQHVRQRQRPVQEVAREVATIPGKAVIFWDDHLTANRLYALELFKAIAPYRKWWITRRQIEAAFDHELLEAAADSGCKAFFIGLESVSRESLKSQGKGFNKGALYEQAVKNLHRHGIAIQAGTMFGLDGDDPDIFERTLNITGKSGSTVQQSVLSSPCPEPLSSRRTFLIGGGLTLLSYLYFETHWIAVKKYRISIHNLPPAFHGFTILHLSNLHSKEYGAEQSKLL